MGQMTMIFRTQYSLQTAATENTWHSVPSM